MRQSRRKTEYSLRFLVLRAVAVAAAVVAALLLLRSRGVIVQEWDMPVSAVQGDMAEDTLPPMTAGETPREIS